MTCLHSTARRRRSKRPRPPGSREARRRRDMLAFTQLGSRSLCLSLSFFKLSPIAASSTPLKVCDLASITVTLRLVINLNEYNMQYSQCNTSAFRMLFSAWTSCVRQSPVWVRPQCSCFQSFSSSIPSLAKCPPSSCATRESWPTR